MFNSFIDLVETFCTQETTQVRLPKHQIKQRLKYNDTSIPLETQTLCDKIINTVFLHPDKEAVVTHDLRLTYSQLHNSAISLAKQFEVFELNHNSHIIILLPKGAAQVIAVLACSYEGLAYIPVAYNTPQERIESIIKQGNVSLIITTTQKRETQTLNSITIDSISQATSPLKYHAKSSGSDTIYTIFTSGSTGVPKGVTVSYKNVQNTLYDMNRKFPLHESDKIFAISSLSFDLSVYDIYASLISGATIVLPNENEMKNAMAWIDWVFQEKVTVWNSVPAIVQLLMSNLDNENIEKITSLKNIFLSGDFIPLSLIKILNDTLPTCKLTSLGGSTEASIWSIYYPIKDTSDLKSIPYGYPLANQKIHIFDKHLDICPDFVHGEIVIEGDSVALYYIGNSTLTQKSFYTVDNKRFYKTGDIGFFNPKGYVEIVGRIDNQVKIQGYRVDMSEIQYHLNNIFEIKSSYILLRDNSDNSKSLIAYIVLHEKQNISTTDISIALRKKLSIYMVPSVFYTLKELPLTDNGKVDVKHLQNLKHTSKITLARTSLEVQFLALFSEVLSIKKMGIHDDFFESGGHSLLALLLVSKLNTLIEEELPVTILFEYPSVAKLVASIEKQKINYKVLTPIQKNGNKTPIFAVPGIGGYGLDYQHLSNELGKEQPFYTFQAGGINKDLPLEDSIETIASKYILEMKKICPGPYKIIGSSFGGVIAYEIALQLRKNAHSIIILDSTLPQKKNNFLKHILSKSLYLYSTFKKLLLKSMQNTKIVDNKQMRKFILNNFNLMYEYEAKRSTDLTPYIVFLSKKNIARKEQENWKTVLSNNNITIVEINTTHEKFLKNPNAKFLANKINFFYKTIKLN